MDDENDPVIYERTVYLSRQLHSSLLLLQYPVRSADRNYDQAHVLAARAKPRQQCVELELALDPKSCHYSLTSARDTNCKDKLVLTSAPAGAEVSRYAVGVLSANELHLTPLSTLIQLRPNYGYVDAHATQLAAESAAAAGAVAGDSSQDEGDDDAARTVTVRFRPHESEDALARRMASFEHHRRKADEEAWVTVGHNPVGSEESELERLQLFADEAASAGAAAGSAEFYMSAAAYRPLLIPRAEADMSAAAAATPLPSNILSLAALKTMSFGERIRALMRSVRAMRFAELVAVLKSLELPLVGGGTTAPDAHDILRHLQQCAVLVQGCWVVKSDVLYAPADAHHELTGTPNSVLCRARDFVLWRFEQVRGATVSRKEIGAAAAARLAPEDEREILDKIARRSAAGRGWEFRMERDTDFLSDERFRAAIKRQESLWQHWQVSKADSKQTPTTDASTTSPKQKRVRGRTKSYSGERSMSDQSDTDGGGVETVRRVSKKCSETSSAAPVDTLTSPSHSNQAASYGISVTNASQGSSVDKGSGQVGADCRMDNSAPRLSVSASGQPVPLELIDFARERLMQRTVLTTSSLRTQLDLFLASAPPGSALGTIGLSATPLMLERALVEAGATRIDGGNDATSYVATRRGDSFDAVRLIVVEMLSARQMLKLGALRKRVEDAGVTMEPTGAAPTDNELRAILKEYCMTRGGCWSLKDVANSS